MEIPVRLEREVYYNVYHKDKKSIDNYIKKEHHKVINYGIMIDTIINGNILFGVIVEKDGRIKHYELNYYGDLYNNGEPSSTMCGDSKEKDGICYSTNIFTKVFVDK